jgi:hypothetical protein
LYLWGDEKTANKGAVDAGCRFGIYGQPPELKGKWH